MLIMSNNAQTLNLMEQDLQKRTQTQCMIVVVLVPMLSVFLNARSDTSELLSEMYHAQVRTVKISLTFIAC